MVYGNGEKLMGRLMAYLPNGDLLGPLSHPVSWQASVPFNDVGSLELVYHQNAPNWSLLTFSGMEVSLQIRLWDANIGDTDFWFEPPGCRFLNLRNTQDTASRDEPWRFSMPNYAWLLRKVRQIDMTKFTTDGVRPYLSVPGKPIKDLVLESQARGNVPELGVSSFNDTTDSDGQSWSEAVVMAFEPGQDAMSMLDAFAKQRLCDWVFRGTNLYIYNPNTSLAVDRTATVKIFDRRNAIASPSTYTLEDMAVKLFNQGDSGKTTVETFARTTPWGNWEEAMTSSGVTDLNQLKTLAQKELKSKYDSKQEYTKQLVFGEGSPMPFVNYNPGDLISTDQSNNARVQQITLVCGGSHSALQGSVVLTNDPDVNRIVSRELRQQRYLNSLIGGAGLGGPVGTGGNGMFNSARALPPSPAAEHPVPAQVTGVSPANFPGFDPMGNPYLRVAVSWNPVTVDTTGASIEIGYYQVMVFHETNPSARPIVIGTSGTVAQVTFVIPENEPGNFRVFVRAVSSQGRVGAFSAQADVALAFPDTVPPQPSAPSLFSRSNQVRVAWNGNQNPSGAMPTWVPYVRVYRRSAGTPPGAWVELGTLRNTTQTERLNDTVEGNLNLEYRFVPVSGAGIVGPESPIVAITSQLPAAGTVADGAITTPKLADGAVTTEKIGDNEVTGQKIASYTIYDINLAHGRGSERNLIRDPSLSTFLIFPRLTVSNLAANTNARCQWISGIPFGVATQLGAGGEYDARFVLVFNDLWPDAQPGDATQALPNLDYACQVDPDYGNLRAGFRFRALSDTWPATGGIQARMFVRYYVYDGTPIGGTAVELVSSTVLANTPGSYVVVKTPTAGVAIPADAAFCLPYLRVTSTNMAGRTNVQVILARPFLMQSYTNL